MAATVTAVSIDGPTRPDLDIGLGEFPGLAFDVVFEITVCFGFIILVVVGTTVGSDGDVVAIEELDELVGESKSSRSARFDVTTGLDGV